MAPPPRSISNRKPTHHPPRATSVIQLFMNGGPSQMDLFDPKPVLNRMDGPTVSRESRGDRQPEHGQYRRDDGRASTSSTDTENRACGWPMYSHRRQKWRTRSVSSIPCGPTIPTMTTPCTRFTAADYSWATPRSAPGRSMVWERRNQNLPAYVVLNDPLGPPKNGTRNWTSGFLPPLYQGDQVSSEPGRQFSI